MALLGKIEEDVELKVPTDKAYETFSYQAQKICNASSTIIAMELHEGHWNTPGSVKCWTYNIGGKTEILEEKMQVDEASKSVIYTARGGNVLEQYKSCKTTFQAIPTGGQATGKMKVSMEFEKLRADDPPPKKYLNFVVNLVKDVDSHLAAAA